MEEKYLRLDCRIKRYNRLNPAVFLIDAGREPAAAAVFDRRTYESLDNRKGQGPRPLKTHAYNYSYIEGAGGEVLVSERASNRKEAEAFAVTIMRAARPIPREDYLEELDRIVWPQYPKEEPAMRGWQERAGKLQGMRRDSIEFLADEGEDSSSFSDMLSCNTFASLVAPRSPEDRKRQPPGVRKDLVKETVRLMERMDRDDLLSLYRYALMLLEG